MKRDAFGFQRVYSGRAHHGSRVRDVFAAEPDLPRTLDLVSVGAFFAGVTAPERSFFEAVRAAPLADPPAARRRDLGVTLRGAVRLILETSPRPVGIALSGGLDSAVVLAMVLAIDPNVTSFVLVPRLAGYDESDAAFETARSLDAKVEAIEATADDIRAELGAAVDAMEVPIYNLHPVSKWLLARAARSAGIATMISGDAADHVFTRDTSADYLPLASAAFDAAGVALRTPFLDDDVVAHVLASPPDRDKRELRDLAATIGLRASLVREAKVSRLAPPIDLEGVVWRDELASLAAAIERPLPADFGDDRTRVRWTTLALLVRAAARWP